MKGVIILLIAVATLTVLMFSVVLIAERRDRITRNERKELALLRKGVRQLTLLAASNTATEPFAYVMLDELTTLQHSIERSSSEAP